MTQSIAVGIAMEIISRPICPFYFHQCTHLRPKANGMTPMHPSLVHLMPFDFGLNQKSGVRMNQKKHARCFQIDSGSHNVKNMLDGRRLGFISSFCLFCLSFFHPSPPKKPVTAFRTAAEAPNRRLRTAVFFSSLELAQVKEPGLPALRSNCESG